MKPSEVISIFTGQAPYIPIPQPPEDSEEPFEIDLSQYYRNFEEDGFRLYIEVVRPAGEGPDGEQLTKVERFDVTGMANKDLLALISALKEIYPDAVAFQAHFCGHPVGERCIIKSLEVD